MRDARLSVVIPAHDEAAIIGGNLEAMIADGAGDLLDIVVVANGCTDDTASIAASVSPRIRVVELREGSKIAALNAGDTEVHAYPVAYVDADVRVSGWALLALAEAFDADPTKLIGAPRLVVDASRSSWLVRQYYKIWELTDYRQQAHVGSGVYVLTEEGRSRFDRFPDVIADDLFVLRLFRSEERLALTSGTFVVRAPGNFRAQVRRATRITRGNRQLADRGSGGEWGRRGALNLMRRVLRRPSLWPAFVVYAVGYTLPRISRRRPATIAWNRDDTTRIVP